MRLPDIIEKSGTRHGEYVAYFDGVQRIRRDGAVWVTYGLGSSSGTFHYAFGATLWKLASMLQSKAKGAK